MDLERVASMLISWLFKRKWCGIELNIYGGNENLESIGFFKKELIIGNSSKKKVFKAEEITAFLGKHLLGE
jgi:hypothetical protein